MGSQRLTGGQETGPGYTGTAEYSSTLPMADPLVTRRPRGVRADSLAPSAAPGFPRDSSRAASVLDTGGAQAKALGLPPLSRSSKRWSSALDYSGGDSVPTPRSSRPGYTEALIKSSRRLRERSMSPTARPVSMQIPMTIQTSQA